MRFKYSFANLENILVILFASGMILSCSLPMNVTTGGDNHDFLLFRGLTEEEFYGKNPEEYRKVLLPAGYGYGTQLFFEQKPAFRIKFGEIKEVVVRKEKPDPEIEEAMRKAFKRLGTNYVSGPDRLRIFFTVAIKSSDEFRDFLIKTKGQIFEQRFAGEAIGIGKFYGSFEGNVFALYFGRVTAKRIKAKLPNLVIMEEE